MTQSEMMLYEKQAEVAQAIAHPIRLAVLNFLRDGEQCVCDIAEAVGSERSNLSRHLSVMVAAGVLDSRKEGLKVFYRLKCPCILDFFSCIGKVLRQNIRDQEKIFRRLY
ncbi:MAG: winged helix-turn-helix transcriptional regulator [Phycisphaerae bacterium]|nr:winged helix-turn-helix transcriptional regulator [Phycisphaerae bacterium]